MAERWRKNNRKHTDNVRILSISSTFARYQQFRYIFSKSPESAAELSTGCKSCV